MGAKFEWSVFFLFDGDFYRLDGALISLNVYGDIRDWPNPWKSSICELEILNQVSRRKNELYTQEYLEEMVFESNRSARLVIGVSRHNGIKFGLLLSRLMEIK